MRSPFDPANHKISQMYNSVRLVLVIVGSFVLSLALLSGNLALIDLFFFFSLIKGASKSLPLVGCLRMLNDFNSLLHLVLT